MTKILIDRSTVEQALKALKMMGEKYGEYACDACDHADAAIDALRERLAQPERHELQAKGEHPAPCARHCEANAFQIVIKNLKAQLAQPEQEPNGWMLVPVKPTPEMLRATEVGPVNLPLFCWKAMVSAAPNPPQPPVLECLCKDRCLHAGMYQCRGLPSPLAATLPKQEPVGYWEGEFSDDGGATLYEVPQQSIFGRKYRNEPLYASPPQREPMTEALAHPEQELVIDCPRCGHCCPPQRKTHTA